MKDLIFVPKTDNENLIVEFTDNFILDKKLKISIPSQYVAIVFDNEKMALRIEPCVNEVLYKKCGKDMVGHTLRIAFVHNKAIPEDRWGFGNIQVNNERLQEAYRVGTNGTFQTQITSFTKLINTFSIGKDITLEMIKERISSVIKTVGVPILSACFANTDVSIFEINSLVGQIRDKMQEGLFEEEKLQQMGIRLTSITVAGIHVNEEDIELIRERINK